MKERMMTIQQEPSAFPAALDRLLADVADGDAAAFETLYRQMSAPVYALALSILKSPPDAEDVLQECFIRIFSAASAYRQQGKGAAWIMTIARNLCMQILRERSKQSDLPEDDAALTAVPEDLSPEDRLVITRCMEGLTSQERQILTLHAVAGVLHREIAEMLGISLPTELSKYHRALKKMKKLL